MASTPLHSRAAWGARPARRGASRIASEGGTVHYVGDSPWSGADRSSPARFAATAAHSRCASLIRGIQAFHLDGRGWSDIAYNGAACPHGHRYDLRGPDRRSAANGTNTGNTRSVAVLYLAGAGDPVTDPAKSALADEGRRLGAASGHRLRWNHADWKATACAGDPVRRWQAAGWPQPSGGPPVPDVPPILPPSEEEQLMAIRDDVHSWIESTKPFAFRLADDGTHVSGETLKAGQVYIWSAAGMWHVDRPALDALYFIGAIQRDEDGRPASLTFEQVRTVPLLAPPRS